MIGKNKTFIVAEISANHVGKLENAINTIKAAKRAGADAVKLQTFKPETITLKSDSKDFLVKDDSIWNGQYLYDLYEEAQTPWEWHEELYSAAKKIGLLCFSSPFDKTSVDFLESLNNPVYKIASCEITDIPLIKYIASKKKPIILSTGVAKKKDIELAINTIRFENKQNIICLLKCTTSYPAPLDEANLLTIKDYEEKFKVIPGLSDHTLGITAPIVAVALGARVIEKHFIIDRSLGGPDASFSLNENEFKEMVGHVRKAEILMGESSYILTKSQRKGRNYARSLYVTKYIENGQKLSEENVKSIRPGFGLHPKYFEKIIGKTVKKDLFEGDRLSLDNINM